jgi:UDP-glucose 4-epimerase
MNVAVTGGAGYVGSVVTEELIRRGYRVVVLDNLGQGHRGALLPDADFIRTDISDRQSLKEAFSRFKIEAVMHLAGETIVAYSATDPQKFFQNNIAGGINLLNCMREQGITKIIFSSSAAVYGEPRRTPVEEDADKQPVNAYGDSKWMIERILNWYGKAYGLQHISLRYFNAAGASERLGEDHRPETHLIPAILKAALNGSGPLDIFGADYPTRDGCCVRDYVHVRDIGRAHILALEKLEELSGRVYNLGNQQGYSVLEVVSMAKQITGVNLPTRISARRPGDPAVLVASSLRANQELGWQPERSSLEYIIESAWKWLRDHPHGYEG